MNSAYGRSACRSVRWVTRLRTAVRGQLVDWGMGELADDAGLVLSELAANAILHGEPPVRVAVTLRCARGDPPAVRIEVTDCGPPFDADAVRAHWRHPAFSLGEEGRGLYVVDAVSRDWGDRPTAGGHTVWAELAVAV
ncbi:ATP-binding protein [Streptomyces sp. NPDC014864]|uniref:ATP-binding protein n=1 Tax=Streptomyces sp. NPDC014864 TaxID=3364924 RepID=UPI0036FCE374